MVILVLLLANGVFAGAEIAVVAIRETRLQQLVEEGRRGASAIVALRAEPENFLATVQIGVTVISAAAAAFGGARLARHVEPLLLLVPGIGQYAEEISFTLVVASISYLSVVFGELVPKSLALRSSESYALLVSRPILSLSWAMRPLVRALTATSNVVLRPFGDRTTFSETHHSAEELQQLVDDASKAGTLDLQVGEIASRALQFGEIPIKDLMVPRTRIRAIPYDITPAALRRLLLEEGHSRMPVFKGSIDNVVGYVTAKDVLALAWEKELIVLDDLIRPPSFVPETALASQVLQDFRAQRSRMAIVVDEHGAVSGLITLEDIVEELVGDLFREDGEELMQTDDSGVVVRGHAPIRDVNRALSLTLPEGDSWSTIAGLCIAMEGRIPEQGTTLTARDGILLEVLDASPRVVRSVRIRAPSLARASP